LFCIWFLKKLCVSCLEWIALLLRMGANIITVNPPPSPNGNADTSLQPPDIDMFFWHDCSNSTNTAFKNNWTWPPETCGDSHSGWWFSLSTSY
jgi:hypothetical protein